MRMLKSYKYIEELRKDSFSLILQVRMIKINEVEISMKNNSIKRCSDSYKRHLLALTIGPVLKMIEAFFDLMIPLFMKAILVLEKSENLANASDIDPITRAISEFIRSCGVWIEGNSSLNNAIIGGVWILVMGIIGFGCTMLTQYIAARTAVLVGTEIRDSLYQKILSFSKKEREKYGKSKLLTTLNADTYQVQQGVLIFIRLIVRAPFIILGALLISFVLNWKIGLVYIAIIPLILIVIFVIMRKTSREYLGIQERLDGISTKTSDTVEGVKVIRAFNAQKAENDAFDQVTEDYKRASIHVSKLNAMINPLTFAIISLATVAVVFIGGNSIFSNASAEAISLSTTIITEVAYLVQIFTTLVQLTNVVMILTKSRVSKRRIDEIFSVEVQIVDGSTLVKKISSGEEILAFDHVSFGYKEEGNKALQDIDFRLKKGQSLGLIGGTGSGKSTIISLMERFIDASDGTILYKGEDIKNYSLSALREEIGYVPQKSTLFKGTILSNMRMAKEDATEEEITACLKDAMAYDFVSSNEAYLDYEVEEGGKNFSGGQRQRLCIARGLLKRPEVLILDDATSALDLLTDKSVRANIADHCEGVTKIIVSQRVSTISDCDLILVLDGGRVIAKGTHEELMRDCQIYQETYLSQTERKS